MNDPRSSRLGQRLPRLCAGRRAGAAGRAGGVRERGFALAAVALTAAAFAAPGQVPGQSGPPPPPLVVCPPALPAGTVLRVDGNLDEPAWASAAVIGDLTQQDPRPGEPSPWHTEVRVLATAEGLVFGFDCRDPEAGKISIHTLQRDGDLEGDDHVSIALDTFGDGRTGYLFSINAAGARQDGLIAGPESWSTDWDGLWQGRARRVPGGWTAEAAIPSLTLRVTRGPDTWGFNVERYVARARTTLRWAGVSLDANFTDLSRAGRLGGISGLPQGRGVSVSPYGLVRSESGRRDDGGVTTGDVGGDLTWSATPGLTGVLTANTDFAETEVDERQINLTRFSLFFPEKRAFFLEGSSQFEFGLGLGTDFIPFFSRRMGLYEGEPVPILAGAKLLGRTGRWGLGLVDVRTGDAAGAEGGNLFAGRVTYDADEHLRVGAIGTAGDPAGTLDSRLCGADAVWQTSSFRGSKNLAAGAWIAASAGDRPAGDPVGWGIKLDYPNDLVDAMVAVKQFGEALDPRLGFLPRPGTRFYQASVEYMPRPAGGVLGWARQVIVAVEGARVDALHDGVESWEVDAWPFVVETQTGEIVETGWIPQYERLDEPFEVADGVLIPAGEHHFARGHFEIRSSEHRPWHVFGEVNFGGFYDGDLAQLEGSVAWSQPNGHAAIEFETEYNDGDLPGGRFVQRLHQLQTRYSFSPDLWLAAFVQYDSESDNAGLNLRLRWTVRPGSDVYLVWNRDWERPPLERDGWNFSPVSDQAVLKARWTLRW